MSFLFLIDPIEIAKEHYRSLGANFRRSVIFTNFFLIPLVSSIFLVCTDTGISEDILTAVIALFSIFTPLFLSVIIYLSNTRQNLPKYQTTRIRREVELEKDRKMRIDQIKDKDLQSISDDEEIKEIDIQLGNINEKRNIAERIDCLRNILKYLHFNTLYAFLLGVTVLLFSLIFLIYLEALNSFGLNVLSAVLYFFLSHFFVTLLFIVRRIYMVVKTDFPQMIKEIT